jgi:hypothetical protein
MADDWLYIPFPSEQVEQDPVVKDAEDDLSKSGRNVTRIPYCGNFKNLGVKPDANLIIAAHGLKIFNYLYLGAGHNRIDFKITANDLAEQLDKTCQMDKDQLSILLMSCEAGGTSEFEQTTAKASQEDSSVFDAQRIYEKHGFTSANNRTQYMCFASTLAEALGIRGYRKIHVGGWPGRVIIANPDVQQQQRTLFESRPNGGTTMEFVNAEDTHIQWFDSKGSDALQLFKGKG